MREDESGEDESGGVEVEESGKALRRMFKPTERREKRREGRQRGTR